MRKKSNHSHSLSCGSQLRGDKGRFQLFGDTVNTASRMESTGEKGRIQCSAATAALLKQAGKEHWLTPREGKIVAKGKGEMDTFWIHVTVTKGTSVGRASNVQEVPLKQHHQPASETSPLPMSPPSPAAGLYRRQYPEGMGEF